VCINSFFLRLRATSTVAHHRHLSCGCATTSMTSLVGRRRSGAMPCFSRKESAWTHDVVSSTGDVTVTSLARRVASRRLVAVDVRYVTGTSSAVSAVSQRTHTYFVNDPFQPWNWNKARYCSAVGMYVTLGWLRCLQCSLVCLQCTLIFWSALLLLRQLPSKCRCTMPANPHQKLMSSMELDLSKSGKLGIEHS